MTARTPASADLERARLVRRLLVVINSDNVCQVALATGHHRETVRRYIAGQWPSAEFLAAVCRAYHVNGHWLLTGRGKGPRLPRARKHTREGTPPRTGPALHTSLVELKRLHPHKAPAQR